MVSVLIYHWDQPHLFTGGYLGVDMFFVISGFVIGGLLLRELERTGRLRFPSFYTRRMRRLLPALALLAARGGLADVRQDEVDGAVLDITARASPWSLDRVH